MDHKIFLLLILSSLIGMFLAGSSFTGMAIADDNCLNDECYNIKEMQNNHIDAGMGVLFILGSVAVYMFIHHRKE